MGKEIIVLGVIVFYLGQYKKGMKREGEVFYSDRRKAIKELGEEKEKEFKRLINEFLNDDNTAQYIRSIKFCLLDFGNSVRWNIQFGEEEAKLWLKSNLFDGLAVHSKRTYISRINFFIKWLGKPFKISMITQLDLLFAKFTENFCKFGAFLTRKDKILHTFNQFLLTNQHKPILSCQFSRLLKNYEKKDVTYSLTKHKKAIYTGIALNEKGLSLANSLYFDREEAIVKAKTSNNLQGGEACKLLSCKPSVRKLKLLIEEYNKKKEDEEEFQRINLLKAKKIYKNIEKFTFQQNISWFPNTKMVLAIYLTTTFNLEKASQIIKCINQDIYPALKLLRSKFPKQYKHFVRYSKNFRINPEYLKKERKLIERLRYSQRLSLSKISAILRGKGYKVHNDRISKQLREWECTN